MDVVVKNTARLTVGDEVDASEEYMFPLTGDCGQLLGVIQGTHKVEPAAQAPLQPAQSGYSKPLSQSVGRESDYVGKAVAHIEGVKRRVEAASAQELRAEAIGMRLGFHDIRDVSDRIIKSACGQLLGTYGRSELNREFAAMAMKLSREARLKSRSLSLISRRTASRAARAGSMRPSTGRRCKHGISRCAC